MRTTGLLYEMVIELMKSMSDHDVEWLVGLPLEVPCKLRLKAYPSVEAETTATLPE